MKEQRHLNYRGSRYIIEEEIPYQGARQSLMGVRRVFVLRLPTGKRRFLLQQKNSGVFFGLRKLKESEPSFRSIPNI